MKDSEFTDNKYLLENKNLIRNYEGRYWLRIGNLIINKCKKEEGGL